MNKLKLNPDSIRKKLGILGEPIFLGLFIGIILAALAGESLADVILTGINVGAVMLLIPRMVSILVEGLTTVADASRKFMTSKLKGREFYIGLDSAILIGSPSVIASGLLMVPVDSRIGSFISPIRKSHIAFH